MGQHKYNQTAIAAKNGELPPKEYIKREASCEGCIHKDICDSWEKEAYPNDCPPWDGTPCISFRSAADVVERKRGEWIKVGESCGVDLLECPVCHTIHAQDGDAFCRDCGADMRGDPDADHHN